MNIFDQYLDNLKKILLDLSKQGEIILPDKLDGINAEIPPEKFNCDISTNVAMVLSKINKKTPIDLAEILAEIIKKKDPLIKDISVVKPGFINIKFKPIFWTNFIKEIIKNSKTFGVNQKEKNIRLAKNISIPTLLIRGALSNVVTQKEVDDFLTIIPHSEFQEIEQAAHMVAGDRNDIFANSAIKFLKKISLKI